jgi:hypothetical protein
MMMILLNMEIDEYKVHQYEAEEHVPPKITYCRMFPLEYIEVE